MSTTEKFQKEIATLQENQQTNKPIRLEHKGSQTLMSVFVDERALLNHRPVWQILLERARETRLAGCSVFTSFHGFGPHHLSHNEIMLEGIGLSSVCLEIVEEDAALKSFVNNNSDLFKNALITFKKTFVRRSS